MVSPGRRARRGGSKLGCLFSLLVLGGGLYYGAHVGQVYFKYYQMLDAMKSQARLAPSLPDDVIHRRLVVQADSLLGASPKFRVKRGGRPNRITIETVYSDSVDLPFFKHVFVFRPKAEEPL